MDRAMKNLYARVFGALALHAFFIHIGQHLLVEYRGAVPPLAWAVVALFLVLGVAGAWAQARLNAKRAALWTALVVNGAMPVGAFLLHRAPRSLAGGFGIVLLLALAFGAASAGFCAWLLADRRAMA